MFNSFKKINKMIRKIIALSSVLGVLLGAMPVFAMPSLVSVQLETPGVTKTLFLPGAADHSPVVISLGSAIDPASGSVVEGYAFIHYKKGYEHKGRPHGRGNGGGGDTSDKCYAFLANGARWNSPEDYMFDPSNAEGLDPTILRSLLSTSVETWDAEVAAEVFGTEIAGVVDGMDTSSPDGKNEVMFGDVASDGAIAVTIVWGVFRGPPQSRGLVEWDMMFDEADFDWSAESIGVAGKMDFHNIAVHEVGHAAGMGHPGQSCTEETMYAFAGFTETKKRDLNTGDIAGIKELYK